MDTRQHGTTWYNDNNGYIILISMILVGAIGVALTVSLLLLGLAMSRTSFVYEQSVQAHALSNTCLEEGLWRIRDSTSYTGSGTLTLTQGSCVFTVTSQGGQNRIVTSTATVGTSVRKGMVIVNTINPTIEITSWQDVKHFNVY